MTLKLSASASTFTASRDPIVTGYLINRMYMQPSAVSGCGKGYVFDKGIQRDIISLTWDPIDPTDLTNLITFLDGIDWGASTFTMIDPANATHHECRYWGPEQISYTPSDLMDDDFTIQVLVIGGHLLDESYQHLTDESGNYILSD